LFFDYNGQSDDPISPKNIDDILDKLKCYANDYYKHANTLDPAMQLFI
jgi:hypothetical protein